LRVCETVPFHQKNKKNSFIKADYKPKNRAASIKQNWQKTLKEKEPITLGEKTSS